MAESFVPHLESAGVFGSNQFAYRKKRGCKDALAMNVIQWIWWLHLNRKVGLYCSDVSGAFDKVSSVRLARKLELYGVLGKRLAFLRSWQEARVAVVVVNGSFSDEASLRNMVF